MSAACFFVYKLIDGYFYVDLSLNATIAARKPRKLTLQSIYGEMLRLRGRVEDLEDLRELNAAIARNGKKKLVAWDSARRLLDLED